MQIDMYPSDEIIRQNEMIDSFLRGQMSEIEEEKFKHLLETNEEFKKRALAAAMMAKGMKAVGEEQDEGVIINLRTAATTQIEDAIQKQKMEIAAQKEHSRIVLHKEDEAARIACGQECTTSSSSKVSYRSPMFKIITAAASVLLVAYIGYEGYNYHQTTSLGVEYAQPFDVLRMRGDADLHIQQEVAQLVNNVYEGKDLKQTLSRLDEIWNKTIVTTEEGSDIELNFESDYYDYAAEIGWALATGRLRNNQKTEAIQVLEQMEDLYESDSAMGSKVRELKQTVAE